MKATLRRALTGPGAWVVALGAWMAVSVADVWDWQDNNLLSRNELVHGSAQVHELGPGSVAQGGRDVDFFRIGQAPLASYEVIVDGPTDQLAASGLREIVLQRYQDAALVQDSVATHAQIGASRSLRWRNAASSVVQDRRSACAARLRERLRARGRLPRARVRDDIRRAAVQQLGHAGHDAGPAEPHEPCHRGRGVLLVRVRRPARGHAFSLAPRNALVLSTATVPGAGGASGTLTIAHDGGYGDLAGKAVALEPATGFSFDSALVPRPR